MTVELASSVKTSQNLGGPGRNVLTLYCDLIRPFKCLNTKVDQVNICN